MSLHPPLCAPGRDTGRAHREGHREGTQGGFVLCCSCRSCESSPAQRKLKTWNALMEQQLWSVLTSCSLPWQCPRVGHREVTLWGHGAGITLCWGHSALCWGCAQAGTTGTSSLSCCPKFLSARETGSLATPS